MEDDRKEGAGSAASHRSKSPEPDRAVPDNDGDSDDDSRSNSTAETRTADLFSRPTTPSLPDEKVPTYVGLNRNEFFGSSNNAEYDIVTVHGIRDDRRTAWQNKAGLWWVGQELFGSFNIRELDYSYEIDDSADIFELGGIYKEAEKLVSEYASMRATLPSWDSDRPVIWICHDIGGTIVKQALTLAATNPRVYGRIAILTTSIIFLGCPHRANSAKELQDQLYQLLILPGPEIKQDIVQKVINLAVQVTTVNNRFSETKLACRAGVLNIFSLQDAESQRDKKVADKEPQSKDASQEHAPATEVPSAPKMDVEAEESKAEAGQQLLPEKPRTDKDISADATTLELATAPVSTETMPLVITPFRRHTVSFGYPYETICRFRFSANHQNLVKGFNPGDPSLCDWISLFRACLNGTTLPLDVNSFLLPDQSALLSLAPPRRTTDLHFEPLAPSLPFIDWIHEHEAYKRFTTSNLPGILYLHGHTKGSVGELSQRFYIDYDHEQLTTRDRPQTSVLYFQFEKRDSRFNNIRSMLVTFINDIIWHFWISNRDQVEEAFQLLTYYHSWSLDDLYNFFSLLRDCGDIQTLTLFISCFDECDDHEREWFLTRLLESHTFSDLPFKVIISTNFPENMLLKNLPESSAVDMSKCPAQREEQKTVARMQLEKLEKDLASLLQRRPIFKDFGALLRDLIGKCKDAVHIGQMIVTWLGFYRRGAPKPEIEETIRKLLPANLQSTITAFVENRDPLRATRAKNIYHWVKYAEEPLTPEMLAQALALMMSPDEPYFLDIDYEDLHRDIEQLLGGMVIVDGRDIKFSHDSIYELADWNPGKGDEVHSPAIHKQLAETCLRCLLSKEGIDMLSALSIDHYGGTDKATPLMLPRSNFVEYAVRFWASHYLLSGEEAPAELAMTFFGNRAVRDAWAEAHFVVSNTFTRVRRTHASSLPYMAAFGLDDLISRQIELDQDKLTFNEDCWVAIVDATRYGRKKTALLLLDYAQVDESHLQEAIFWAAAYGKGGALDDLLGKARGIKDFQWPRHILCRAASAGLETLISALADSEYDMNEKAWFGDWTAIGLAAHCSQEEAVKLLLESQVDLTQGGGEGNTPVIVATKRGNPTILKLLLDASSNLDQKKKSVHSGLVHTAIATGRPKALEVLLGAEGDFKTDEGEDSETPEQEELPIVFASRKGYTECVRLLLENEVDMGAATPAESALYVAAENGHIEICRLLLEKGVTAKNSDESKEMLLLKAISTRKRELVELLIDKGSAPVNAVDTGIKDYNTPLARAAKEGSKEIVDLLLARGARVNPVDPHSEPPLFVAAYYETSEDIAARLINAGADIHWRREWDGWEALHASYDEPGLVTLLLKSGANIDSLSKDGTALMLAARWGFWESLQVFLAHSPKPNLEIQLDNPNSDCHTFTALLMACKSGSAKCVRYLLEASANLAHETSDGQTAVAICLREDESTTEEIEETLKTLLEFKPDLSRKSKNGDTVLHGIRFNTPVLIIKLLLEAGAPLDESNADGYTPLAMAVRVANIEAARFLVSQNANVNIVSPKFGSILNIACEKSSLALVKLLVEAKANPRLIDLEFGDSVLYTAVGGYNSNKIVRYLVDEAHVDVNAPGGRLGYPLIRAADESKTAIVKYLIRRHADVNATDELGRRAVHIAAATGNGSILRALIKAKADAYARDKYGRTPVHFAASSWTVEVLDILLEQPPKEFDLNHVDQDGWTPLMWACRWQPNDSILKLLTAKLGADLWARSRDNQWSALKLANFHDWDEDAKGRLRPPEEKRTRKDKNGEIQTWDDAQHESRAGDNKQTSPCWSCFEAIRGLQWKCMDCQEVVNLCFKCYGDRATMHRDHHFEEIGPLYMPLEDSDSRSGSAATAADVAEDTDTEGGPGDEDEDEDEDEEEGEEENE